MILEEFSGYVGNNHIKEQLSISLLAAKKRNTSPPHMLFIGHPGCGKTKMSELVAKIQGTKLIRSAPETLKGTAEVHKILEGLPQDGHNDKGKIVGQTNPGVIFLDEIHNLPLQGQEAFGIAMEYFKISTQEIKFRRSKDVTYWVPRFTLIGATTETGKLSKPFFEKFQLICQFELYSNEELMVIIFNYLKNNEVYIEEEAARETAIRSRGTPRLAIRYSERILEIAHLCETRIINKYITDRVFNLLGVDEVGLTPLDRKILIYLYNAERPVGVDNLAVITGEAKKTLETTVEPFLLRQGLILKSPGGRVITEKGEVYLSEKELINNKTSSRILYEE
jgi:Holliday junction DNA helicase RuvB